MAESSIARARRLATEKREKREAEEAAATQAAESKSEKKEEKSSGILDAGEPLRHARRRWSPGYDLPISMTRRRSSSPLLG